MVFFGEFAQYQWQIGQISASVVPHVYDNAFQVGIGIYKVVVLGDDIVYRVAGLIVFGQHEGGQLEVEDVSIDDAGSRAHVVRAPIGEVGYPALVVQLGHCIEP